MSDQRVQLSSFAPEVLEPRQLLAAGIGRYGVLEVTGTSRDDRIQLAIGATVDVIINSSQLTFAREDVNAIRVDLFRGNDQLVISSIDVQPEIFRVTVYGNAGDDTIFGGPTHDRIFGNEGNDSLFGDGATDNIFGGEGDDSINGGAKGDLLYGEAGNDQIFGGKGSGGDFISGGDGQNVLTGGDGSDTLHGGPADTMDGGADGDILRPLSDHVAFGAKQSTDLSNGITRATSVEAVEVSSPTPRNVLIDGRDSAVGLFIRVGGRVTVYGSAFADDISGGIEIDGGAGDDRISAFGADVPPTVLGGPGNDTIAGSNLDDQIDAGDGDDSVLGDSGDDFILGGAGFDTLNGSNGNDTIHGGDQRDSLFGESGEDRLEGGGGNDSINGGRNADRLYGQNGNDTLNGGGGNDLLFGGATSADTIIGGAGDNDRAADDDKDSYSTVEVLLT